MMPGNDLLEGPLVEVRASIPTWVYDKLSVAAEMANMTPEKLASILGRGAHPEYHHRRAAGWRPRQGSDHQRWVCTATGRGGGVSEGQVAGGKARVLGENFTPSTEKGKTREIVGAAVGMSGPTYQRARAVVTVRMHGKVVGKTEPNRPGWTTWGLEAAGAPRRDGRPSETFTEGARGNTREIVGTVKAETWCASGVRTSQKSAKPEHTGPQSSEAE